MVKPKEKLSIEKTKIELNWKVDLINFKINIVDNRRNDAIVIQSENIAKIEKIKKAIEVEMQIIIMDINYKLPEKVLIDKLKKRNGVLENSTK